VRRKPRRAARRPCNTTTGATVTQLREPRPRRVTHLPEPTPQASTGPAKDPHKLVVARLWHEIGAAATRLGRAGPRPGVSRVEVMGRYSNQALLSRLERVLAVQKDNRASSRSPSRRPKQVQVRLTDHEVEVVAAAYESGLTLNELASAFGPDRRTLASRLDRLGVTRRGQSPHRRTRRASRRPPQGGVVTREDRNASRCLSAEHPLSTAACRCSAATASWVDKDDRP
jgi:hypothetical protein